MIMLTSTDERPNSEGAGRLIARRRRGRTKVYDSATKEQLRHGAGMPFGKMEGDTPEKMHKRMSKRIMPMDTAGVMRRVKRVKSSY